MQTDRWWAAGVVGAVALTVAAGVQAGTGPDDRANWRARMDVLAVTFSRLLVDVASTQRSADARTREQMLQDIKTIQGLTHDLSRDKSSVKNDPSTDLFASMLGADIRDAAWAVQQGRMEYARAVIFNSASTCMACHARRDEGARYPSFGLKLDEASLAPLERAALHAATRRFDQAWADYEAVVNDPRAPLDRGLDWDRAVGASLSLAVRVFKDPDRTRRLADTVSRQAAAPYFLRQAALAWAQAADAWKAEGTPTTPRTEAALLDAANKLLETAMIGDRTRSRRGSAVYLLRATVLLHEMLGTYPQGAKAQDGLMMLGVAYEGLEDQEPWMMHPAVFEACIRKAPKNPTARLCLERYEAAIFAAYSGSGGYQPPADARRKLADLARLVGVEMR